MGTKSIPQSVAATLAQAENMAKVIDAVRLRTLFKDLHLIHEEARAFTHDLPHFKEHAPAVSNRFKPSSDGHPVLLAPGFLMWDEMMNPLRSAIAAQGYRASTWGLGPNLGPFRYILKGMDDRVQQQYEESGKAVSIVGWSLGYVLARSYSRFDHERSMRTGQPQMVRQVIGLGGPIRMEVNDHFPLVRLAKMFAPETIRRTQEMMGPYLDHHAPVPTTSIYSSGDRVALDITALESVGDGVENIKVRGSHSGLVVNVAALIAISDRLARPEGSSKPFVPEPGDADLFELADTWDPGKYAQRQAKGMHPRIVGGPAAQRILSATTR